ncbi:MAG: FAD-dependent oxidoreductase [Alphaproteobacteria bacterium]|jgi:NADPH-dependent glutamate synthase beta subunit-like oxidoreductase/NAD(P)H-flavin reductase|nr:FAD-dependent oxidoreductase [Rhodospirillaceae bacterium]MDG2482573.1 FAD-dependent oxidoreductase [Alphaproteobacteria bacterium]
MSELSLAHGLVFEDLYDRDGLIRLDRAFVDGLKETDTELHNRLMAGRAGPSALEEKELSELLVDLSPALETFVAELFGIGEILAGQRTERDRLNPIYTCKLQFVRRRAAKAFKPDELAAADGAALRRTLEGEIGETLNELTFARAVMTWLEDEEANADRLAAAARFAAWATLSAEGQARYRKSPLFHLPGKIDPANLVAVETIEIEGVTMLRAHDDHLRLREGFALTDQGMDLIGALDQANYCIFCHNQGKDSCSKGLKEKDGSAFKTSPSGVALAGCPLDEKVSEMNLLKAQGHGLGALAVAMVDNPLCAATGHRICNDCMKACIYQRQEPVDIPQIETRTLKDVLSLPWGFEIYSLLSRWNPLDLARPLPRPPSGRRVLVVGLGPAGFNLSHHLMNDGHTVVAVDGLKIEPLEPEISGIDVFGTHHAMRPIRDVEELYEGLDDRVMAGFGGVAEYGITVRWNKNYLKLIRLQLERRNSFRMIGGVRFGGTLTIDSAFGHGFDHIAHCAGAGRPTYIDMPNALARGVRMASDFLMALQLTGAAREASIACLQLRLPAVVIGGGLTAIDTATEALAYYPVQVEKFLTRFETLAAERGEEAIRAGWNAEETEVGETFLAHGHAIRNERTAARNEERDPDILSLLDSWGGVTMAYRRDLTDAPSYRLNHEEVALAMEEGIRIAPGLSPAAIETDEAGHARAIRLTDGDGAEHVLDARAVLVAAGTQPNTVLAREDLEHLGLDGRFFQAFDLDGHAVTPERMAKPAETHVLMYLGEDRRAVSFHGDLHPSFAGNVVKAMGGAKRTYPVITEMLGRLGPAQDRDDQSFVKALDERLVARVVGVERLTPTIVEVVVEAPEAASMFLPGQFYRLQNYETFAPKGEDGTLLAMEPLAMTGASIPVEGRQLSVIGLEMGGSSDLMAKLRPGEPVILMGPTGTPTQTPPGETVLLIGGGLGNAVLFSIGRAMREAGSRVLYAAGYKNMEDRYKVSEIEAAADTIIWACDEAPGFEPGRPQDSTIVGNIVEAILAYQEGRLGSKTIDLTEVDRIVVIGSDRMMAAIKAARFGVLAPHLKPDHVAIGSINSPMQCMMKEICAQCLQPQVDPETGERRPPVFSCFNQDQRLDCVDFKGLGDRLAQNGVHEKLTRHWIDRTLRGLSLRDAAE